MTYQECLIVGAYTGVCMTKFGDLHDFIEKRLGRPVWTHEMARIEVMDEVRAAVRDDFLRLCAEAEANMESEGKE